MPADPDTPRGRRVLSKDRMEGFSDGVFGFAMTLLVLGIALRPPGTPLQQVLHAWRYYLAYVVSFLTIGGTWLQHTALTDQLARVDQLFLRLNLLVLLVVVFLPFPTELVADALQNSAANGCMSLCTGSRCWPSASWDSLWTRTHGTSTSTHRQERARSCIARNGNSCRSSSGT